MNIAIKKHIEYCSVDFTTDECLKIFEYFDSRVREIYEKWEKLNPEKRQPEYYIYWYVLVSEFANLPEGKKTKAWFYQTMLLNDVVDDGINGKSLCPVNFGFHKCQTRENILSILNRGWIESDSVNICGNLALCMNLAIPHNELYLVTIKKRIVLDEFNASKKTVQLDDTIIRMFSLDEKRTRR